MILCFICECFCVFRYEFSSYQYGNLDTSHMMTWAIQAASGMEYLAGKKIVHGDIAARNMLLTSTL